MNKKFRIAIAGIGGVGGFIGGKLAARFKPGGDIEIIFIARGENERVIKARGLKLITSDGEHVVYPSVVTHDTQEVGAIDLVIVCTKSYDLENIIYQLSPCIDKNTIILPLLNGVDSKERIQNILPGNTVPDGCVYIVSRLKQPGVIENSGNIQTLFFGQDHINEKLLHLERLFKEANIEATLSDNIKTIIWEKYIFISAIATATSYFNQSIGHLLADKEKLKVVTSLIKEVKQVASAKKIIVAEDITEKTLHRLKALPFETTSSMHSDFLNNKPVTESGSLTRYVIEEGGKHNIATPTYKMAYEKLKGKS